MLTKYFATRNGLLSSHCLRVLDFVNVIKISISFSTSILVISHSVTFFLGYNNNKNTFLWLEIRVCSLYEHVNYSRIYRNVYYYLLDPWKFHRTGKVKRSYLSRKWWLVILLHINLIIAFTINISQKWTITIYIILNIHIIY